VAFSNIGAADEIHGESGDDFIYGQKGNDVIFGEGQDDDIIGGYGGEFALYDEYDPLRKILLNTDGSASKWTSTPTGVEFFLNFDATEGPAAALDPAKKTDGDDKIFGDLGNDWLVGGSGRDDMYGGFGNDLLNADDCLIFDWQSNTDFKFAGINVSNNKLEMGHRTATGWVVDTWTNYQLKPGIDYIVMLTANGSAATLWKCTSERSSAALSPTSWWSASAARGSTSRTSRS